MGKCDGSDRTKKSKRQKFKKLKEKFFWKRNIQKQKNNDDGEIYTGITSV